VDDARWLDATEQQVWRKLLNVHARLIGRLDAELHAAHGISLADYEVLVHLSEAPDAGLRMAQLADRLVVSPSGLTRRLDGLVRDGIVVRVPCPSDRRGSMAVLSPAGRVLLERAAPIHVAGVRRYLIDRLDRPDLVGLGRDLDIIAEALDLGVAPAGGQPGAAGGQPGSEPVTTGRP